MSLIILLKGSIAAPALAVSPAKYLRYDDRALFNFISDELVKNKFTHVEVVDGYPHHKKLSVPCIAIEHNYTKENHLELGRTFKEMDREYTVDIFARTKGERDDIQSFLMGLFGRSMITDDGRENAIYHIAHAGDVDRPGWLVTEHGAYYRVYLDGTAHGYMPHDSAYITNKLTVDIDFVMEESPADGNKFYIFDKYLESQDQGFRFYVENDGGDITINFDFGIALAYFHYPLNFEEYIGERVQVSATFRFTGTVVEIGFYINGSQVAYSIIPWFLSVNTGDKDIYLGARYEANSGNIVSRAPIYIYALRISNSYETSFGKTGEYLFPNVSKDLTYLPCNEGKFNTSYDHGKPTIRDLTWFRPTWDRYLRKTTQQSKFYQSINRFKLRGLRNLNVA